jgi:uncharacterized protein (DUF58 family)
MWKRWIIWIVLLLAAGVLYLFENGAATMALLIATAAVPVLAMLPLLFCRSADAALDLPDRCVCGDAVIGTARLLRSVRLPLAVTIEITVKNTRTDEEQALSLTIAGREAGFSVRSEYCGLLRTTVTALRMEDPFGLVHRTVRTSQTAVTRVVPKLFPTEVIVTETAFALPDSDRFSPDKPGSDPSETFGIREYRPGDNIKTIHWKLSQKSSKTVVRELSLPVLQQVLLLLDTRPAEPEVQHSMTTAALSISAALLEQGVEHTLGWTLPHGAAPELHPVTSEAQYAAALDWMLAAPVSPDAALSSEGRSVGGFAHVAVISAAPLPGLADIYNGSRVTLLLCGSSEEGLTDDGVYLRGFDSADPSAQLFELEL